MSELQGLYDQRYVDRFERVHRAERRRLRGLLRHCALRPTDDVLDVGCGSGLLAPWVAPTVRSYTGVDFSAAFITTAETRAARLGIPNAAFVCSSISDFARSRPAAFDVAFAFDLAEHVPDAEWVALLEAAGRTLRPAGRLYLHTPNAAFFLERLKARNLIVRQFPEHVAVRTATQNMALLQAAGFRVARVQSVPHYNVLRLLHPLGYLPIIGPLFRARLFFEAVPSEHGAVA